MRCMVMRAPLAARGWPTAMAPPSTFVRSRGSPSSFSTARYCGAKASFTSKRSNSESFAWARASVFWKAATGPMPMMVGSTPAKPQLTSRASGCFPFFSAQPRVAIRSAPAPSETRLAERPPPAHAAQDERGLAHRFGAADQHQLCLSAGEEARALHHRLEARAAQTVHGERGGRDGCSRPQADVAGEIDGVRGRLGHVAEDDVVHPLRRDASLRQRSAGGVDPQVGGGEVLE